jgi:hypothetical protein
VDSLQQEHAPAQLSGDEAASITAYDAGMKIGTE